MAKKIYVVRHAQGEHNATRIYTIPDPLLTPKGKSQCRALQDSFEFHDSVDLVVASPLRRTIQTASLSFGPALARKEVPFIALPGLQEVSTSKSDTGLDVDDLQSKLPTLFSDDDGIEFDFLSKLDLQYVENGWNSKKGIYAYTREAIMKRAAVVRSWLYTRPEENIVVVSHGAFMHFLTEDWDVHDPMTGTAYNNCEVRSFTFTPASTSKDAHFNETPESRQTRGANEKEHDPHVIEELVTVAIPEQ